MGLDSYLFKSVRRSEGIEEFGYWRKANAIHKWFVDNVQDGNDDCQMYEVSRDDLWELFRTCREVLDDHTKAPDLLPTQDGFFFGGTDYDMWYFDDIRRTIDLLEPELNVHYPKGTKVKYYYQSSW